MKNKPQQQRSIDSTERMLDAAERLISEGGLEAMTVDAVVRLAGTSNGSLYARFGDRLGLLAAVQDRFLERLSELRSTQAAALAESTDLAAALEATVRGFAHVFLANRRAFDAFMLQTLSIPAFRERGSAATREAAADLSMILEAYANEISHDDFVMAADFVFRTLFALVTQLVMFPEAEVTGTALDHEAWIAETVRVLHAYLST